MPGHLSMELLQSMAGFEMVHVPYKGPAPATQDVVGGQVPCGLLAGPTVLPHVRSGKLVALAVSGKARSPTLPDVPTIAEAGVPGYAADFSLVMFAPRGTPQPDRRAVPPGFRRCAEGARRDRKVARQRSGWSSAAPRRRRRTMLAADSKKWGEVARRIKLGLD